MASQTNFLYSILEQAQLEAASQSETLSTMLAVAAVNSNWGKLKLCNKDMFNTDKMDSKFYQLSVAQVEKSSWVKSVADSVLCTPEGK